MSTETLDATRRRALARRVLSLLDLTSLGPDDPAEHIARLCAQARDPVGPVAAVCVHRAHVSAAKQALAGSDVRVATVANFPEGGDSVAQAVRDTLEAIALGADEVDLVLPWRAVLRGDIAEAAELVRECRAVCGPDITLKLILETGELDDPGMIRLASEIGLDAGVDFLKTSTGKVPVNATPEAAAVMLEMIWVRGGFCGFKAAGGVRTLDDAARYIALAEARLGADWVTPARFRIGASALRDELVAILSEPA